MGCDNEIGLYFAEDAWEPPQLEQELDALLNRFSPEVVYAPSRIDFHPEHHKVAYALAKSLQRVVREPTDIRIYQVHVPLTPVLANLVSPIGEVWNQSVQALRVYETQWGSIARVVRMRRYEGHFYGLQGPVEVFWELPPEAYCHVHFNPPFPWPAATFRGVRSRPFSDPLAYLQGVSARREIRRSF